MRDFIQFFLYCVECFFILYMVGYASFLFLSVTVGTSTLYAAKRRNALKNELSNEYYVPVSIIVPAYNEAVTIEATVRSLLALDYRLYEIIVVDDGSSDDTSRVVQHAFGMHRIDRPIQQRIPCQPQEAVYETRSHKVPITLIRKRNGGKSDALNMGINASNFPIFCALMRIPCCKATRWKKSCALFWKATTSSPLAARFAPATAPRSSRAA